MFDLGNVVLDNIEISEMIAASYGLDEQEYKTDYHHYVYPLMDGTIDAALYFKHVYQQFNVEIPPTSLSTFFHPTINPKVKASIISLRKEGHTVVCASNTYKDHYDIIRDMGVLDLFDYHFASHEIGICKPARQFFEYILKKTDFSPSQSFFFDDLYENVEMSRKMGIQGVWFYDEEGVSAIEKLEHILVKVKNQA